MDKISDNEIKEIVQRVLQQTGQAPLPVSASQQAAQIPSSNSKMVAIGSDCPDRVSQGIEI
jgi:hypothetical protein